MYCRYILRFKRLGESSSGYRDRHAHASTISLRVNLAANCAKDWSKAIEAEVLSPWWRRSVAIIMLGGFAILIWLAFESYSYAPPVPKGAVALDGRTIFT